MTTVSLPFVLCDVCGRLAGEADIYHPTICCSPAVLKKIKGLPRQVSVEAFARVKSMVTNPDPKLWEIVPGCKLGIQRFVMDEPPGDFLLDVNCSLIAEKALSVLKRNAISVYASEVEILCPRKPISGWQAVDLPDLRILTEKSMKALGISQCPRCGEITSFYTHSLSRLPRGNHHELVRDRWPRGLGVARIRESSWRVVSPEFMEVWQDHKLTGIQFVSIGRWV